MENILDKIVVDIKEKIEEAKRKRPLETLKKAEHYGRTCNSLQEAIRKDGASGVIAEFKLRSPSKGIINADADVKEVCKGYQDGGASAVSVLTNHTFFGGCNEYLTVARSVLTIPVLRKEFIVDEYQIHEAKAIGADFILLIAEILTKDEVTKFTALAHELGMEVLMELHSEDQLEKIIPELDAVGINNRDLKTFTVDVDKSIAMAKKLPAETIKIAESGLRDPKVAIKMREEGFVSFLVGEQFMDKENPGQACADFCAELLK